MESTPPFRSPEQQERSRAFGAHFRQVREAAGCSVRSLAQATRISAHFIEALEAGSFELLPGEVFGRGFVRSLCKALNLDAAQMVAAFDECWDHTGIRKSVLEVEIKEKPFQPGLLASALVRLGMLLRSRRLRMGLGGAILFSILSIGVWQWNRENTNQTKGKSSKPKSMAQTPEQPEAIDTQAISVIPAQMTPETAIISAAERTTEPSIGKDLSKGPEVPVSQSNGTPIDESEAARLSVIREGAGDQILELAVLEPIRIRSDIDGGGTRIREYTPGSYEIRFNDKVEMMVYNAAAVKISFNGRPLGVLGSKGRVRRISFQAALPNAKKM